MRHLVWARYVFFIYSVTNLLISDIDHYDDDHDDHQKANAGQHWSTTATQANTGLRQPRRLTMANAAANDSQPRPTIAEPRLTTAMQANDGQRRPTQANAGQRRPTKTNESPQQPVGSVGMGPNDVTRCLGPGMFCLLFYSFTINLWYRP